MTDLVLDVCAQLGKGLAIAVGLEDGIVAEALTASTLTDNLAVHDTFEGRNLAINNEGYDSTETGFTIIFVL